MSKQEAKAMLQNKKELKGHEIYNVTAYSENNIVFTSCKGNKCYYGLLDDQGIDLEYAGNRNDLQ